MQKTTDTYCAASPAQPLPVAAKAICPPMTVGQLNRLDDEARSLAILLQRPQPGADFHRIIAACNELRYACLGTHADARLSELGNSANSHPISPTLAARLAEQVLHLDMATERGKHARELARQVLAAESEALRCLLLIEHATSDTHDDGGHHEAAHDLALAGIKALGGAVAPHPMSTSGWLQTVQPPAPTTLQWEDEPKAGGPYAGVPRRAELAECAKIRADAYMSASSFRGAEVLCSMERKKLHAVIDELAGLPPVDESADLHERPVDENVGIHQAAPEEEPTVAECLAFLDVWNGKLEAAIDRKALEQLGQHANDGPVVVGRGPMEVTVGRDPMEQLT